MAFGTRVDLLAALVSELDRDDLTDRVPGFLALAESNINADTMPLTSVSRATAPINEDYEMLPPNFRVPLSAHINGESGIVRLRFQTPDQIAALRETDLTGCPQAYTIIGTEFWFDRTPGGQQLELSYYTTIPALVVDGDSNDVLRRYPGLYFYGALKHSAPFLKDDSRIALWDKLYNDDVARFNAEVEQAKTGAGPLLVRPRRGRGFN